MIDGVRAHALAIRAQVAALELVACRMTHERVRWAHGRVVRDQAGDVDVVTRVPLCNRETRTGRLACGHTPARNAMQRALIELGAARMLTAGECAAFASELEAIGHAIQLLDHRKGDAEKAHALLTESRGAGAAGETLLETSAARIRELERHHDGHVERLRDWRDRLLRALDAAIHGSTPASTYESAGEQALCKDC